jgi:hypothetical protein
MTSTATRPRAHPFLPVAVTSSFVLGAIAQNRLGGLSPAPFRIVAEGALCAAIAFFTLRFAHRSHLQNPERFGPPIGVALGTVLWSGLLVFAALIQFELQRILG